MPTAKQQAEVAAWPRLLEEDSGLLNNSLKAATVESQVCEAARRRRSLLLEELEHRCQQQEAAAGKLQRLAEMSLLWLAILQTWSISQSCTMRCAWQSITHQL